MKLFYAFVFSLVLVSPALAREEVVLARITGYWAHGEGGSGACAASNGARLHIGHCAVDPTRIPYGSKVVFHGKVTGMLHRAVALSGGEELDVYDLDLPESVFTDSAAQELDRLPTEASLAEAAALAPSLPAEEPLPKDLARYLDEVEREILIRALEHHRYNRTAAGISLIQLVTPTTPRDRALRIAASRRHHPLIVQIQLRTQDRGQIGQAVIAGESLPQRHTHGAIDPGQIAARRENAGAQLILRSQEPGGLASSLRRVASNRGVDDARDLRERAFYAPAAARYKIYIIDEAHMVSKEGFNALLKLVEEPPEHVKFVFATTEPDKVIGTIRSRTHHYPFRLVPPATVRRIIDAITDGLTQRQSCIAAVYVKIRSLNGERSIQS
jgi:hypothetical protein